MGDGDGAAPILIDTRMRGIRVDEEKAAKLKKSSNKKSLRFYQA